MIISRSPLILLIIYALVTWLCSFHFTALKLAGLVDLVVGGFLLKGFQGSQYIRGMHIQGRCLIEIFIHLRQFLACGLNPEGEILMMKIVSTKILEDLLHHIMRLITSMTQRNIMKLIHFMKLTGFMIGIALWITIMILMVIGTMRLKGMLGQGLETAMKLVTIMILGTEDLMEVEKIAGKEIMIRVGMNMSLIKIEEEGKVVGEGMILANMVLVMHKVTPLI